MYPTQSALPDNLLSKFSRIYVAKHSFKDESGKDIQYERFVLEYMVKGEPLNIELKVDKELKKDIALLKVADSFGTTSNIHDSIDTTP